MKKIIYRGRHKLSLLDRVKLDNFFTKPTKPKRILAENHVKKDRVKKEKNTESKTNLNKTYTSNRRNQSTASNALKNTANRLNTTKHHKTVKLKPLLYTMCIGALSVMCVFNLAKAAKTAYTVSAQAGTDWGLYYENSNTVPRGNSDSDYLSRFDAYYTGKSDKKVLFLTFDAGYESGYTNGILDTLAENEVTAAFFLVGHYFESSPSLVRRMADEGHLICNHTQSHPDMSRLSQSEFQKELYNLEKTAEATANVTVSPYYRPPAGKYSEENLTYAKQNGYKTIFWSVAYADWDEKKQPSASSAMKTLTDRVHNGAIILLHLTSKTNSEILDTFIKECKKDGYVFLSLDAL